MLDALDVHRSLLAREVPHEIVRLPRLVLSADEIPEVLGLPADRCVAVRMYLADEEPLAVLVRAGDVPHPGAVLATVRARALRSARAEVVNEVTDFAATLVCPVLLPATVRVIADTAVGAVDVVYTATGDGGTALGIPSRSLLATSQARVATLCQPTAPTLDLTEDVADGAGVAERLRHWR